MKFRIFQADAFTDKLFRGNPAAVCMLESWLPETTMQAIAAENNLAETAFVVPNNEEYEIRWFTPTVEVDLCGHATLAAAHIIFEYYNTLKTELSFESLRSGKLIVSKQGETLMLDFPVDEFSVVPTPQLIKEALGIEPMETLRGRTDYMAVLPTETDILRLKPNFSLLSQLDGRGLIVTATGVESDFVSRFFGPQSGIDEDPVTGSAHTTLTPYWAKELGKTRLSAIQLSARRGYLKCELLGNRVTISGKAVTYLQGEVTLQ